MGLFFYLSIFSVGQILIAIVVLSVRHPVGTAHTGLEYRHAELMLLL